MVKNTLFYSSLERIIKRSVIPVIRLTAGGPVLLNSNFIILQKKKKGLISIKNMNNRTCF